MIGADVLSLDRMGDALAVGGQSFVRRTFCAAEIAWAEHSEDRLHAYASAFAVKEAVFKALALEWNPQLDWPQLEVARLPCGAPSVQLHGEAAAQAAARGVRRVDVSVSYESDLVFAVALASQ